MEQEEQENRDHDDHQESGGRLEVIEGLAQAGDPDTGIFTHDLRLVNGQGVHYGVLFTLGLKDQESVTVIDLVNGVGVEYPFTVDHRPIGDDISLAQLAGILHSGIKDQIAGQQNGVHRFRLDGEHPDAENAGHAVTGGIDKGHISAEGRQYNGNDQHRVHNAVEDLLALAYFRNGLRFFAGIGGSHGGCFLFQLLHREASLLWLVFLLKILSLKARSASTLRQCILFQWICGRAPEPGKALAPIVSPARVDRAIYSMGFKPDCPLVSVAN